MLQRLFRRRSAPVYYEVYFVTDTCLYRLRREAYAYRWYGVRCDRNLSKDEFSRYLRALLRQHGVDLTGVRISFLAASERRGRWVRRCVVRNLSTGSPPISLAVVTDESLPDTDFRPATS